MTKVAGVVSPIQALLSPQNFKSQSHKPAVIPALSSLHAASTETAEGKWVRNKRDEIRDRYKRNVSTKRNKQRNQKVKTEKLITDEKARNRYCSKAN